MDGGTHKGKEEEGEEKGKLSLRPNEAAKEELQNSRPQPQFLPDKSVAPPPNLPRNGGEERTGRGKGRLTSENHHVSRSSQ